MTRYVTAWYVGGADTVVPFQEKQMYPLTVKKSWWSKKITVYQRHHYSDEMLLGTLHTFNNQDLFDNCWQIIKEEKWHD